MYSDRPAHRITSDPGWGSRPLIELTEHLRLERSPLLDRRLAAIADRFRELWLWDHGTRQPAFNRLSEAFDRLRDRLRCSAALDHDVVHPLVARVEAAVRERLLPDASDAYDAVTAARGERHRLRRALGDAQCAIDGLLSPDLPLEIALLCADMDTLLLLVLDQLDLEDRHLWPRLIPHLGRA